MHVRGVEDEWFDGICVGTASTTITTTTITISSTTTAVLTIRITSTSTTTANTIAGVVVRTVSGKKRIA